MSLIADEEDELYRKRGIGPFSTPLGDKADAYLREERQRKEREDSARQEKLKAARYSTYSALDTNPDEYAQARELGAQAGVSPEAAMDYQADLKRQARMESIDFGALPPALVKALSAGSGFASMAHDDIESLAKVESDLRVLGKNIAGAVASSVPRTNAALWGLGRSVLDRVPFGLGDRGAAEFGALANQQKQLADSLMPKSDSAVVSGIYSGLSSIPTAAIGLGLSALTGNPYPAIAMAGGLSAGEAYNEARNKGLSVAAAHAYAIPQGVSEAALELLPASRFLKDLTVGTGVIKMAGRQIAVEAPTEQLTTIVQDMNEWAVLRPEATFKDYLEERPRAAAETFVATVVATAGLVGGVKGASSLINSQQREAAQAEQAITAEATLSNLEQAVEQSALRKRAPDAFAQFVKDVVDSDGVDTPYVFIDGQKLAQSEVAPALAEISPSVAQQLPDAVENGGDVHIPMEEYLTNISGTEAAKAIHDDLKLDADGMPFGEARALYQEESGARPEGEGRQLREKSAKQLHREAELKKLSEINRIKQSEAEQIRGDVLERLNKAGRFSSDVNQAYAALSTAFFETMADRTGQSASALYEEHKVGILAQRISEENTEEFEGDEVLGYYLSKHKAQGVKPSKSYIRLLSTTTMGTFLHESGHWFLDSYAQMATTSPALQTDMDVLLKWFGIKDLQTWNAMTINEQRENHERFARGFEHYLMEGRAPSIEMQSLFDRFKSWLKRIYESFKDLNVDLNDEVRGVMDRMIATDVQIEEAERARGFAPVFSTQQEAQAHGVDWTSYLQAQQEATETSRAALDARRIADMTWANRLREKTIKQFNKDALEKRKEVKADAQAELSARPVYQAIRFLRDGEITRDGEEIKVEQGNKIDLKAVSAMFPESSLETVNWKSLGAGKRGMLAEDGLPPDVVAELFGFRSGEAMVRELVDAAPFEAAVNDLTDQRMFERFGDITSEEALGKAADEAIFNDVRARFVAGELAALKDALGGERVLQMMAKDRAISIVNDTLVKDLNVMRSNSAMAAARAGRASEKAFKEQDIQEAAEQKRKQLIQLEAAKLAVDARANAKNTLAFFKNIVKKPDEKFARYRSLEIVNVARFILAEYGLADKRVDTYGRVDALEAYSPEIYKALERQLANAQTSAKPFNELTVAELEGLKDVIESLWAVSRREKLIEIEGKKVEKEAAVKEIVSTLSYLPVSDKKPGINSAPTNADKAKRMLQGARAWHRRVEHWVDNLDNGDIKGAIRTYIFNPISAASDRMRTQQNKRMAEVEALLKNGSRAFTKAQIEAPELNGYIFGNANGGVGHIELLGALLHAGNNSNKEKLLVGRGWGAYREDGSIDTSKWDAFISRMIAEGKLVKEHFDFVQGVWDLLEELKPEAQKAYRTIYGTYFDEITADKLDTPFGTYRGGYYPAVADPFLDQDVEQQQTMNSVTEGADYMFPVTPKGFTQSRVKINRPLAMDLRLIGQHVNKVLLFSNLSVPVRDVLGLLRDKDVKSKLNQLDPTAYNDLLLPWLNRAAKQIVEVPMTGWGGKGATMLFRAVRRNTGMAYMFLNLINAAQNFTGLSVAAAKVKTPYLAKALFQCTTSYKKLQNSIAESSPFMANRLNSTTHVLGQEIEKILVNPGLYQESVQFLRAHSYFLQQATQNVVDTVVWHAAYNQALDKDIDEDLAAREADAIVRQTQGSLNPEDVSRVETGTALARTFTQFISYFNMVSNVVVTEAAKTLRSNDSKLDKAQKLAGLYMKAMAVPTLLSMLIATALSGGPPADGSDDESGYLISYLKAFIGAHGSFAGVGGATVNALFKHWFTNNPLDDRLIIAPAVTAAESAMRSTVTVPDAIFDDGKTSKAIKDTGVAISLLLGLPIKALTDRLGYVVGVGLDEIEPKGPADFVRGLVTGRAAR